MTLAAEKAAARKAAFERRKAAHAARPDAPARVLGAVLDRLRGLPLAGFLPIHSEIDPRPAMAAAAAHGPVGVPVIMGRARPLRFAAWAPGMPLRPGPFGAPVPNDPQFMRPTVLIVPLVAFTAAGARLGYGGGFYDRTLAALRASGPVIAIGFAYAAQEAAALPHDPNDQPLDLVVTEAGIRDLGRTRGLVDGLV